MVGVRVMTKVEFRWVRAIWKAGSELGYALVGVLEATIISQAECYGLSISCRLSLID